MKKFNCCFGGLLAVVGLLLLAALGMFSVLAGRVYRAEQDLKTAQALFEQHYTQWQAQNIHNYQVTYSHCTSSFCCERAQMRVENSNYFTLVPNCNPARNTSTYFSHNSVNTLDPTFEWLRDQFQYNRRRPLEISYHPELHYITRVVFVPWTDADAVTIEYTDLQPAE